MMNTQQIDRHLEQVKDRQIAFKNPAIRGVAVRVVETAIASPHSFWPDQVEHDDLADADRNTIGSAFRLLVNAGLITRANAYRRSTAAGAKGRTIFGYSLTSRTLAETFLRRNGSSRKQSQLELFTA